MVWFEGYYYLVYTSNPVVHPSGSALEIVKASSLEKIHDAPPAVIWSDTDPSRSSNMWAPELHRLKNGDGYRWYLYYTAGPLACCEGQRVHVLESQGDDPLGPYIYKSQLTPEYAIDGSVFSIGENLYFLYCQANQGNHVHIAPMKNPYTLSGLGSRISSPAYSWEKVEGSVNEAPAALVKNGKVFVTYSYNDCSSEYYGIGMLTADATSDLLDPASWKKSSRPVLQRNAAAGVYGPGHNGFFKSPDGREDWIIYHANSGPYDGCSEKRVPRVQKVNWLADGTPDFGNAVSVTASLELPSGDSPASGAMTYKLASTESKSAAGPLRIYPNPAKDLLNVEFTPDRDQILTMQLWDKQGQSVGNPYLYTLTKDALFAEVVSIKELPPGIYFLKVASSSINQVHKIIVERQ